jgi:hypothetical protein
MLYSISIKTIQIENNLPNFSGDFTWIKAIQLFQNISAKQILLLISGFIIASPS